MDGDGWVEYALYGAPGELPSLPEGEADVGGRRVTVRGEEVPDDWEERWKRFHVPILVGGRLYVRPPWEQPAVRPGVAEIVIDPGRAFGTGSHPTTRLCLELMLELEPKGSFADLGCGSGVLAIAAAKLGFEPVAAFDSDAAAIEATLANARDNARRARPGRAVGPAPRRAAAGRDRRREPDAPAPAAARAAARAPGGADPLRLARQRGWTRSRQRSRLCASAHRLSEKGWTALLLG